MWTRWCYISYSNWYCTKGSMINLKTRNSNWNKACNTFADVISFSLQQHFYTTPKAIFWLETCMQIILTDTVFNSSDRVYGCRAATANFVNLSPLAQFTNWASCILPTLTLVNREKRKDINQLHNEIPIVQQTFVTENDRKLLKHVLYTKNCFFHGSWKNLRSWI